MGLKIRDRWIAVGKKCWVVVETCGPTDVSNNSLVDTCLVLWIPLVKFKQGLCILSSLMWSFFFPLLTSVSILTTLRRELEKLKRDLEEEKLLRSNLEVVLSLWEGVGSLGMCRLCSGIWCHRKVLTNLFSLFLCCCFILWLNECLMRHLDI